MANVEKLTKKQQLWVELLEVENQVKVAAGLKPIYSEKRKVEFAKEHKTILDRYWTIKRLNERIENAKKDIEYARNWAATHVA